MERKNVVAVSAVVLVLCLVSAAFYVLSLPNSGNQAPSATPTPTPAPTPLPTPAPTAKPAPGVTSIDFTKWHPSGGQNTIIVAYPAENAVVENANVSLKIYAASKNVGWAINSVYYIADWLGNDSRRCFSGFANLYTDNVELTINFHDIPDGYHTFSAYLSVHDYSTANVTMHFTTKTD